MDLAKLREPFAPKDIHWRIGRFGVGDKGPWAMVLAYVDNRAIMDRLDEVCGPDGWANEFLTGPSGGVLCGIRILIPGQGWVTKYDGAENSDIEAVKGGLSDAMKRAAVHWGIGRYLYSLESGWATFFDRKDQARYTHYDKDSKKSYYWSPPALPEWAIPKSAQEPPKAMPANSNPKTPTPSDYLLGMERALDRQRGDDAKLAAMIDWVQTDECKLTPEQKDRFTAKIIQARRNLEAVPDPSKRNSAAAAV